MTEQSAIVYLNGQFLPLEQAFVPVLDRGFIFGDGVYEVIPVYGGRLFRLGEHLQRLDASLAGIRLANPMSHEQWGGVLNTLVARNGGGEQSIYLQITRGVAPRDHAFPPAGTPPTVFATSTPLKPMAAELLASGAAAITLEDIRWKHCDIKAITLLPNVLLRQQAIDAGAQEAILIRDGLVTEGTASNIFMVKDGVINTPPTGPFLLPGVTRDLALELAAANGLPHQECDFSRDDLLKADEAWLSSSTRELLPITHIDGQAIGSGSPGQVWRRMNQFYQEYKKRLIAGEVE